MQDRINIRDEHGHIVSSSKNLRGIVRYAREKAVVVSIRSRCWMDGDAKTHNNPGADVHIVFADGAFTMAQFASRMVARDWIERRMIGCSGFGIVDAKEVAVSQNGATVTRPIP